MDFASKIHTDYEKIYEETLKWINEFKLHTGDVQKMYKRENITKLTCMVYPDGDYERTLLMNKWMMHVYALDDAIEGNVRCPFFDMLLNHGSENKDVISLLDKSFEDKETPLVTSFAHIWKQLKSFSNKTWQQRFAENFIWSLKTNDWENKNVEMKRVPSLGEYLEYRHFLTGVDVLFNLIEIARNISIPDSVVANVTFQRFTYLTGNIAAL
ncbi:terpene synthase metal-binding domain-containing protein-like protein, partial [Leptotrombidium deliense]